MTKDICKMGLTMTYRVTTQQQEAEAKHVGRFYAKASQAAGDCAANTRGGMQWVFHSAAQTFFRSPAEFNTTKTLRS